ncbi:MAG: diguanylate cyclase [Planctomycetes bacterium]|nr:diguanylate cyclase [Planctomycetota bacterium]
MMMMMMVNRNHQSDPLQLNDPEAASEVSGTMGNQYGDSYRRRLLVVGSQAAATVTEAAARPVTVLPSIYDALGELAVTELRAAPDAVICSIDALGTDTVEFTAAVRRIDPSVSLIVVSDLDQEPRASDALADGFDSYVLTPLTALQLERAINEAGRIASHVDVADLDMDYSPTQEEDPVPADPPGPAALKQEPERVPDVPPVSSVVEPDVAPAEDEPDMGPVEPETESEPQIERPAPKASPRFPKLQAPVDASDALHDVPTQRQHDPIPGIDPWSDIEMVEVLLNQPENLRDHALTRIQSELGSTSIQHVTDESVLRAGSPQQLAIAVSCDHESFGHLVAHGSDFTHPDCIAQLTKAARWLGCWLRLHARVTRLREMAYTDDLTGIGNRRFFDSFLDTAVTQARTHRQFLTLLVFDIDNFKTYNDHYGHSAGDEILIETARLMSSVVRPCDKVCRLGGDEFGVIFYDPAGSRHGTTPHPDAIEHIAQRFQEQIRAHKFPKLGGEAPGPLTISAGLASFPWDGHTPGELYEHADRAACRAKASGKNAIIYGPSAVGPPHSVRDPFGQSESGRE